MKEKRVFAGRLCLLSGCFIALILSAVLLWADVEALLYGFGQYGKQATSRMKCPHFLTVGETGLIRVRFKNTTSQTIRPTVKFQASATQLFRTRTVSLQLAPGESQTVVWEVGSQDVVWRHFIFVKMYTFAAYPMPDVEQTCGILVINVPWLRGQQIYLLTMTISLVLIGVGEWRLFSEQAATNRLALRRRSLIFLAVLSVADLGVVSLGWWPPGILLTAVAILMIGILIGQWLLR